MAKRRTKRIPKRTFTNTRGIGWHVCYREPATGLPCKHHFGIRERERETDARVLYQAWLARYIGDNGSNAPTLRPMVSATLKTDPVVLYKAQAAAVWCKHATEHELAHRGKPWSYLLIPHDAIAENKMVKGLSAAFIVKPMH